jgi:hypothetical protein
MLLVDNWRIKINQLFITKQKISIYTFAGGDFWVGVWESGNVGVWKSGNVEMWKCGNLGVWGRLIWESEKLEMWKSENLGVWKSGVWEFFMVWLFYCEP